jgi:hypothetical protein
MSRGHHAIRKARIEPPPGTGECGLWTYYTRADARRRNSDRPDIGAHRRPYRCADCNGWHNGVLPQLVIDGVLTAAEWYGEAGHPPYGEIIAGVTDWLAARGVHSIAYHRGTDGQSWGITGRRAGEDVAALWHPDPVTAAEALYAHAEQARERFVRDLTSDPAYSGPLDA